LQFIDRCFEKLEVCNILVASKNKQSKKGPHPYIRVLSIRGKNKMHTSRTNAT
jgi:hypothetical protein